jgi:hypothetical protein
LGLQYLYILTGRFFILIHRLSGRAIGRFAWANQDVVDDRIFMPAIKAALTEEFAARIFLGEGIT